MLRASAEQARCGPLGRERSRRNELIRGWHGPTAGLVAFAYRHILRTKRCQRESSLVCAKIDPGRLPKMLFSISVFFSLCQLLTISRITSASTPGFHVDVKMAQMMKDVNSKLQVAFVGPPVASVF